MANDLIPTSRLSPSVDSTCVSSRTNNPGFPYFNELPPEIRNLIWIESLPKDVPEIAYVKAYTIQTKHTLPTVDTCFPVAAHVCRESRYVALQQTAMCYSKEAGIKVPTRDFRPDLDILYISSQNFYQFFCMPGFYYGGLVRRLQHIAIDIMWTSANDIIPNTFRYLKELKSLAIVFSEALGRHEAGQAISPLHALRRCRLRRFTADELRETEIACYPPRAAPFYKPVDVFLEALYDNWQTSTGELVADWGGSETGVWDYEKQKLKLQLSARAFEEYRHGASCGGPQWIKNGRQVSRTAMPF